MVGSTLGVYTGVYRFGLIFVSARTKKRHHHQQAPCRQPSPPSVRLSRAAHAHPRPAQAPRQTARRRARGPRGARAPSPSAHLPPPSAHVRARTELSGHSHQKCAGFGSAGFGQDGPPRCRGSAGVLHGGDRPPLTIPLSQCEGPIANACPRLPMPRSATLESASSAIF